MLTSVDSIKQRTLSAGWGQRGCSGRGEARD